MKRFIFLLTMVAVVFSMSASATTLGYWRFEEGTNNMRCPDNKVWDNYNVKWFLDSSGIGNDICTWNWWTSPLYTNAVPYNMVPKTGSSNYLACWFGGGDAAPNRNDDLWSEGATALNTGTTYSNGWTVEASVCFLSTSDWQVVIGKDGAPDSGAPIFSMKFNVGIQGLEMNCWDGDSNLHWLNTGNNSILIDTWYSIAGICDGSTVKLYLKGPSNLQYVEMGSAAVSGGPMIADYSNWSIGRGSWNNGNVDWCNAIIDEVRISDEALQTGQLLGIVPEPGMIIGGIALVFFAIRRK